MPKLPDWDLPDALENAIGDANEDAKAELDRLRAQKAEANNQWRLDYNACAAERDRQRTEINRLKAENAELKRMIETLNRITRRHATHPLALANQ